MQVEITEMPEMRVASVRHVGPYSQVSKAFERLGSIAGPAGLFAQPGAAMIGLYHDDPETTPPEQLRADAGVVIQAAAALPAALTEQRLPAGLAYRVEMRPAIHVGEKDNAAARCPVKVRSAVRAGARPAERSGRFPKPT